MKARKFEGFEKRLKMAVRIGVTASFKFLHERFRNIFNFKSSVKIEYKRDRADGAECTRRMGGEKEEGGLGGRKGTGREPNADRGKGKKREKKKSEKILPKLQ